MAFHRDFDYRRTYYDLVFITHSARRNGSTTEDWSALVGRINNEVEKLKKPLRQADANFGKMGKENSSLSGQVEDMKGK